MKVKRDPEGKISFWEQTQMKVKNSPETQMIDMNRYENQLVWSSRFASSVQIVER